MARLLRRLLVLAILGAASAAAVRALRSRASRGPSGVGGETSPARWPPLSPSVASEADRAGAWVEPVDRDSPAGFPVKVTASGIYHVPGGQFYDRATPVRCYPSPHAAEADGYRAAKR